MARVNDAEVRQIITTPITPLTAFITAADLILDRYAVSCTKASVAELKEMARWLSAHLIAVTDTSGDVRSETIGPVSVSYGSAAVSGEGLLATRYGKAVTLLDPCGLLVKSGRAAASVEAIASDLSEDGVEYEDIMGA